MSKLFDELTALKEAYDTKLADEGEDAVKELFKEFFDANPKAAAVSWRQYTPYFNDGDPCYFRVGEMSLHLHADEDEEEDEDYDPDQGYDAYSLSLSEDPELKKLGEGFDILVDIPEEVLEYVFGDHVTITATAEGFEISEYNHD
jgi:hypothetical protein